MSVESSGDALVEPSLALEDVGHLLGDRLWRLNHLYRVKNEDGVNAPFRLNRCQRRLYDGLHARNLILKSRHQGVTTFWCTFMLDKALFEENQNCVLIAHKQQPDGEEIFNDKLLFAYRNTPDWLRDLVRPVKEEAKGRLRFNNGSSLRVTTSARSGTAQFLHISELGYTCAFYPDKAKEIITGSFPACEKGIISIESTAKGNTGYFYHYCREAMARDAGNLGLTAKSWRFFFFPWWEDPRLVLSANDTAKVVLESYLLTYFDSLASVHGIELDDRRKAWYAVQLSDMQSGRGEKLGDWDVMKQEYPSFPAEAFEQAVEGAFYGSAMLLVEKEQRVTKVPYIDGRLVDTWWDVGRDTTSIWFTQDVSKTRVHVIDFYQNSGEGFTHYVGVLKRRAQDRGYIYGRNVLPFDAGSRSFGTNKSVSDVASDLHFPCEVLNRGSHEDGIDAVRRKLSICWFDEERCAEGLKALRAYKKSWNERLEAWGSAVHNWASHPADAFRTFSVAHDFASGDGFGVDEVEEVLPAVWG